MTPATVDVWYSPECETRFSVSLCDSDGAEIRCLGGDDDMDAAWARAIDAAREYGIPARLSRPNRTGEIVREWQP